MQNIVLLSTLIFWMFAILVIFVLFFFTIIKMLEKKKKKKTPHNSTRELFASYQPTCPLNKYHTSVDHYLMWRCCRRTPSYEDSGPMSGSHRASTVPFTIFFFLLLSISAHQHVKIPFNPRTCFIRFRRCNVLPSGSSAPAKDAKYNQSIHA